MRRSEGSRSKLEEEAQDSFVEMEEETAAFTDLSDFEFFVAIHQNSWDKLVRACILDWRFLVA
jgi:hypothetical protein